MPLIAEVRPGRKSCFALRNTAPRRWNADPLQMPFMTPPRLILPLLCLALASARAVDFKKDIQPILEKNCYECHSEKTGKKKAGFVFDDLSTFIKDINPKGIVVPGSPGESHMFEVITDRSHKHTMPPDEALSSKDIAKLREWIESGASLDKGGPKVAFVKKKDLPPIMSWTNFEGKKIKAGFVRLDGDNVVLRMPANAQEVAYPLSKLDAASQALAKECAAP